MKNIVGAFALAGLLAAVLPAQRPWQQIAVPTASDAAANFKTPPREYGAIQPFLGWNGPDAKDRMARIVQDLDRLSAAGVFVVNMSPGRGEPKYLSPEHMAQVKFVVQEAAKRGMKLWIQDECDYPSGFAGGKVSEEVPQLTMQALDADIRISVMPGQTLTMPTPPDTLGALAVFASTGAVEIVPVDSSGIDWRAPAPPPGFTGYPKPWELILVRHMFRSSPTRASNRADGTRAKDSQYSLIDYLNPEATRAFHQDHPRNLQAGGRGRVRQNHSGLLRRRARLHRLHAVDAQAAGRIPPAEGLRPAAIPAASVRAQDDRRSLAREGRLLGRLERDFPRDLFRSAGRVVREEQHRVPGPPEPRRGDAEAGSARGPDPQRGRLLQRHAARAGARHRQPEPDHTEPGPRSGRDLERQQQFPQAGLFGRAPVRQAQGLDRIGRRTGHRRQVPVGFPTGARRQCPAAPRSRDARRPRRSGLLDAAAGVPCWRGTPTAPAT